MRRFCIAVALAAVCTLRPPAAAAQSNPPADCRNPYTTVDMIECAGRDLDAVDKKLNDVYRKLTAAVRDDKTAMDLLRDAQRKWIAFRDADCKLTADEMRGGTGAPVLELSCHVDMTERRVKRLEEMLDLHRQ